MRNFFLAAISSLIVCTSQAQVQEAWSKSIEYLFAGPDRACLVIGPGESIYTGIRTYDFGPGSGLEPTIMIKKFNPDGTEVFSILEPVEEFNRTLIDMAVDASGNVYCAVHISRSLDPSVGRSGGLFAVYKYSATGSVVWKTTYGDGEYNIPTALALDAAGNVYVTGACKVTGLQTDVNFDYLTVKWNSSGSMQWARRYDGASPGEGYNFSNDIAVDGSGNVYITGSSQRDGLINYATIKYNSGGTEQWVQRYTGTGTGDDRAAAITLDVSGFVYVTGNSEGSIATVKYNNDGAQLWVAREGSGGGQGRAIKVDAFGGVVVAGNSSSTQLALIKYRFDGVKQWAVNRANADAYSLALDVDGNVYLGGTLNDDGLVEKYNSLGVSQWFKVHDSPLLAGRNSPVAVSGSYNVYVESFISTYRDGNANARYFGTLIKYTQCSISIPSLIEVNTEAGQCGATVKWGVTTTGDCGEVVYESLSGDTAFTSGSFLNSGHYHLMARSHSTGEEKGFTIYVNDAELPVITDCPPAKTVNTDPGVCHATAASVNAGTATATDNCTVTVKGVRSDGLSLTDNYPVGLTTITWTARDEFGNTASCTQQITVIDNESPQITGESASTYVLMPPDHSMRDVMINYDVIDNCTEVITTLTVTSNEPVNGTGDGDTDPDWLIIDNQHVQLRAERAAMGDGRIYTITITAVDPAGNTSIRTVEVTVPKNIKKLPVNQAEKIGNANPVLPGTTTSQAGAGMVEKKLISALQAIAYPNPSSKYFNIQVNSSEMKEKIILQVFDQYGRLIDSRINVSVGATVHLGELYKPGVYYVRVLQGRHHQELKLVKLH